MNNFKRLALCTIAVMFLAVGVFYLAQALGAKEPTAVVIAFVVGVGVFSIFVVGATLVYAEGSTTTIYATLAAGVVDIVVVIATFAATATFFTFALFGVSVVGFTLLALVTANELHLKHHYVLGILALEVGCLWLVSRLGGIAGVGVLAGGVAAIALLAKFGEKRALRSSAVPVPAVDGV